MKYLGIREIRQLGDRVRAAQMQVDRSEDDEVLLSDLAEALEWAGHYYLAVESATT